MNTLLLLTKRNIKLFFKDKGMFFTSLITPAILLVLYTTFLANVYKDVFLAQIPEGIILPEKLINGFAGGQLISSMLAVSCVTVAFCSNMIMVQDKADGIIKDFTISPVKPSTLAMSYYIATLISSLIVCFVAIGICLVYIACIGWYMSAVDVVLLFVDSILLVMFGTALSSIINFFLKSQGQIAAVSTIVSSAYGFICGAYMPIAQLSTGLQKFIMLLPGTYGTSLIRNHAMSGVLTEMSNQHIPNEVINAMRDSIDCNLYFFGDSVSIGTMYAVICLSILVLLAIYILMNYLRQKNIRFLPQKTKNVSKRG